MPDSDIEQGCEDIASQLVNFETNLEARFPNADVDGIDVVLGGGRRHFLSADPGSADAVVYGQDSGDRTDGRNLIDEWQLHYPDGRYLFDEASLETLDTTSTAAVFGLFSSSHMQYEADRTANSDSQPSLSNMVGKAIDVLDNNNQGYFLSVEAGRIDHGHHAGSAYGALTDTIAFSEAVQAAMQATNPADTLIIVTADHSHVFSVGGIAKRGNPILGLSVGVGSDEPVLAADGLPYTTLAYANGLGFRDFGENTNFERTYTLDADPGRKDLSLVDTTSSGFHQEVMVPLTSETHGGEDVGVYAQGPGASLITGTLEQNVLFHVMEFAADLSGRADVVLAGN